MEALRRRLARVTAALVLVIACGPAAVSAGYDWPQFNGGPQHTGNNTQEIAITPDNARTMRRAWTVNLPTNVDGTPVSLHGVQTPRGHTRPAVRHDDRWLHFRARSVHR